MKKVTLLRFLADVFFSAQCDTMQCTIAHASRTCLASSQPWPFYSLPLVIDVTKLSIFHENTSGFVIWNLSKRGRLEGLCYFVVSLHRRLSRWRTFTLPPEQFAARTLSCCRETNLCSFNWSLWRRWWRRVNGGLLHFSIFSHLQTVLLGINMVG